MRSHYKLGAIELIELGGRSRNSDSSHHPFLANYPNRARMGDILGDIGGFITGGLAGLFDTLAGFLKVPFDALSQGVGITFDGIAGLFKNIPIVGDIVAGILLLGKAVIQWALKLPEAILSGFGTVFHKLNEIFTKAKTPTEQKAASSNATNKILQQAEAKGGTEFKNLIGKVLQGKPADVGGTGMPVGPVNPPPAGTENIGAPSGFDLNQALTIGAPVAGAALLLLLVSN